MQSQNIGPSLYLTILSVISCQLAYVLKEPPQLITHMSGSAMADICQIK